MPETERTLFAGGLSESLRARVDAQRTAAHDATALRYREVSDALDVARWALAEFGDEVTRIEVERLERTERELSRVLAIYVEYFRASAGAPWDGTALQRIEAAQRCDVAEAALERMEDVG